MTHTAWFRETGRGARHCSQVQLARGHGSEITQGSLREIGLPSQPADPKAPPGKFRSATVSPALTGARATGGLGEQSLSRAM